MRQESNERWMGLRRAILLLFCAGSVGALVLAASNLLLRDPWASRGVAVVGLFVGIMMTLLVYRTWGSASCLADITALLAASLVTIENALLIRLACALGLFARCSTNDLRAATYGSALAVLLGVAPIWLVVRYLTWQASGRDG